LYQDFSHLLGKELDASKSFVSAFVEGASPPRRCRQIYPKGQQLVSGNGTSARHGSGNADATGS
jgi:hypothetical protein